MAKPPAPYGLTVVDSCSDCMSRQSSMFCGLPEETLRALHAFRQTALYPPGALLFVEGESSRGLFVVCTGQAKLSASSKEGKRITVRQVEPGEALGLSSVIADSPYPLTAETLSPSQVCFFPRAEFVRFLCTHAEVSLRVAEHLSMELHKAWEQTRLLTLAPNARAKLAQLLLASAAQHGRKTPQGLRIPLNMTAEDIGEAIGATRETVSRLLADFKRRRLIRVKGGSILLVHPEELSALGAS